MARNQVPPALKQKFATMKEVEAETSRGETYIKKLIREGELRTIKYGVFTWITRESLNAYLKMLEKTPS